MNGRRARAVVFAFLCASPLARAGAAEPKKPNVLLVCIDTLRPDHLSLYGYHRQTTPKLDRYFKDGAIFSKAYSVSRESRSVHASLLFGVYPSVHGLYLDIAPAQKAPERLTPLAEAFRAGGYRTGAFVGGGQVSRIYGFDRGFQVFEEGRTAQVNGNLRPYDDRRVLAWLAEDRGKPFFLFLHVSIPHGPYLPPRKSNIFLSGGAERRFRDIRADLLPADDRLYDDVNRRFWGQFTKSEADRDALASLYDGDIRYADDVVGATLSEIRRRGWDDRTLVVLLSDHGEQFLEHGEYQHPQQLYEELVRVPLAIRGPGIAGRRDDRLVSLIDVPPTLLALAGLPVPEHFQGEPFLAPAGPLPPGRKTVFMDGRSPTPPAELVAARSADRKVIWQGDEAAVEAYDLASDPAEKNTRAGDPSAAAWVSDLTEQVLGYRRECRDLRHRLGLDKPGALAPTDADNAREMREHGYIRMLDYLR